jgi:hypothetical protein
MKLKEAFLFYLTVIILIFFHGTKGSMGSVYLLIILFVYFYYLYKHIIYSFLISILILSNPGEILDPHDFGLPNIFTLFDLFFFLSFLGLLMPKLKEIKLSKEIKKLLPFIYAFSIYQIFVSIIFTLQPDSLPAFLTKLYYNKNYIFGIYLLIPAYKLIQVNFKPFFFNIIFLATVYAVLYLLSIYANIGIVEFASGNRFASAGFSRNIIENAEVFKLTMFFAAAYFIIPKTSGKLPIYIAGLLSISIIVISVFRLELFYTIMTANLVIYISSKLLNISITRTFRFGLLLAVCVALFFMVFPKMAQGLLNTFSLTIQEFTGVKAAGTTQGRTILELPKHLFLIKHNFLFGTGFREEWFQNFTNLHDWGLSDIPLTSTLAMYGFVGMVLYYARFLHILKIFGDFRVSVQKNYDFMTSSFNGELIVIVSLYAYFITMITFKLFYVGWELTLGNKFMEFGIFLGIFYGLINKLMTSSLEAEVIE